METIRETVTGSPQHPMTAGSTGGYYTEVGTVLEWEEEWNATAPPTGDALDGQFDIMHVVPASLALLIINLAVIIGNILVLLAVYCERALRTVTNYFIVNLAIADLLLGTLVLPFSSAFEVIHYWPFGGAFCDIWAAVDVLCCTASINSLCCISLDRYIGVTRPLKHRLIMTPRRAIMINVFVWIISFGIAVGPLFGWRPVKTSRMECPLSDSIGYVFFSVSGSFYIPSTIILVLYCRIYHAVSRETKIMQNRSRHRPGDQGENGRAGRVLLRIHVGSSRQAAGAYSRRSKGLSASGSSRARNMSQRTATFNREKKVAKTLGIVVGVFIICWLPFFILLPLTSVCKSCKVPDVMFTFFFWLGYCNSCVNPVIYAMSNLTFRRAFRKILTCWYCRDDRRSLRRGAAGGGSRRFSNVSRMTSSTPSPLVGGGGGGRGKRSSGTTTTTTTNTNTSSTTDSDRRGRCPRETHANNHTGSVHQSRARDGEKNGRYCDGRVHADGVGTGRMPPTLPGPSAAEESHRLLGERTRSPNNHHPRYSSLDSKHPVPDSPSTQTATVFSSSNSNHVFRLVIEEQSTQTVAIPPGRGDPDAGLKEAPVDEGPAFRFKPLTDLELSSGIHDSRETSV